MKLVILVVVLAVMALFFVKHAEASTYSVRETYTVYCGIDKADVTSEMKKLSRREIWSQCTGQDKHERPAILGTETDKKKSTSTDDGNKSFDYFEYVHSHAWDLTDPLVIMHML